jgi:aspartyl-tRNA(Asn)/glutamyl-tRNA(Gln) amidotransferase subunit C
MSVDKSTVVRIAELARIKVPEAELEKLAGEMAKILEWVAQLNEVDTEGVAPMTSVADMDLRRRDDVAAEGAGPDRILANAPERHDDFFAVPKVIE